MKMASAQICVVGAGVIGLSTAYQLLCRSRAGQTGVKLDVTVLAERFTPHTTSDGAHGLWEPYLVERNDTVKVR